MALNVRSRDFSHPMTLCSLTILHGRSVRPSTIPTNAREPFGFFLPASVVSWYAFQEAIEGAKGCRILFLDTCHAGNSYNQRLSNDSYQANAIVYSAARWDQEALGANATSTRPSVAIASEPMLTINRSGHRPRRSCVRSIIRLTAVTSAWADGS